jgi:hypothetical protein
LRMPFSRRLELWAEAFTRHAGCKAARNATPAIPPGCAEYAIDPLAHRARGGYGWIDINYVLTVITNPTPDDDRYAVEDNSEQGGDVQLCSNDSDEVADWIKSL